MFKTILKNFIKLISLFFFRPFGYDVKVNKFQKRVRLIPKEEGVERDEKGYDLVWSDKAFLKQYAKNHSEYYKILIDFISKEQLLTNVYEIADNGCGPGNLIQHMFKKWPDRNYYGFDFSISAIQAAKELVPAAKFMQHDIYAPLNKNFDIIFCCETLEHLIEPEIALNNILFKTENKCLLTVPDGKLDTYSGHINFWSFESWQHFLSSWEEKWDIKTQRIGKNLSAILKRK